ncbi:site-2 protease family protein [Nocardia brevicatena]|uniref:site-2 protease family protein n=1 Tax=Nocardia brevicatena TaxID=37327 RepID=UPI0002EE9809|nr:site-2 protease family protein [Nocardia brevicatena]
MPRATIPLGRIAGIRIGAHWSALVTIGLFTWLLGSGLADAYGSSVEVWLAAAVGAVGLFGSLLAHELAHSVVAHRSGVRVERIVLWLLGGVSELGDEPSDARSDLRIAVAGPLTSMVLAAWFFGIAAAVGTSAGEPIHAAIGWLAAMNLVLAVFNLLPAAPLDGGRVLRAVIWRMSGDRLRAATVAARSGRMLGLALIVVGAAELIVIGNAGGLWLVLLGWFLSSSANAELAAVGIRHRLGDIRVGDVMTTHPVTVPEAWSIADFLASPAAETGHQVFPAIDADGRPTGVLAWSDLTRLPRSARQAATVRSIARPLSVGARTRENALLRDVVSHAVLRPDLDLVAVVDAAGRLTGVVTATDLTVACQRNVLGLPVQGRLSGKPRQIRVETPGREESEDHR